tara:strand:+ start:1074 stop:2084 length:1011 start_codon:yes stop_codon:yes gene_type:complete
MGLKEEEIFCTQSKTSSPDITAIIPVFNRPQDLQRLFTSFKILNYSGKLTVIVADDASTDDYFAIYERFKKECPHIELQTVKMRNNQGPAAARNAAIKRAVSKFVWFLDSDSEIFQSDMLIRAVEIFKRESIIKGVGEEVYLFDGKAWTQQFKWYPSYLFDVSFRAFEKSPAGYSYLIPTSNLIVERKLFDEIGLFNPELKTLEDKDVCCRILKKGYKLYTCKEVATYHHASTTGREHSAFDFYIDLTRYAKACHFNRIKLVALHKNYLLPFLPVIDFYFSGLIFIKQLFRKYNSKNIISSKKGKSISFFKYALYHFYAMVSSHFYAYKIFVSRKL